MELLITILIKIIEFLGSLSAVEAYFSILLMLLICGFGVPLPEDITLVAAGIAASLGNISFEGAMLVSFIGVLGGDSIIFSLGYFFRDKAFELPIMRSISRKKIKYVRNRVQSNSHLICFVARFLPGLRALIFLTAGVFRVSPWVFFALDGFASLISIPVWVWLGWYFGNNVEVIITYVHEFQYFIFSGIILLVVGYVFFKFYRRKKAKI